MGMVALLLAIAAFVLVLFGTAPMFVPLMAIGALAAAGALLLGTGELLRSGRLKLRGGDVPAEREGYAGYAWRALVLAAVSLGWGFAMFVLRGGVF